LNKETITGFWRTVLSSRMRFKEVEKKTFEYWDSGKEKVKK